MSIIKQKSEFNVMAADILFKQNLYAPAIHCAYYGCFQRIKSILHNYFGITYDDINNEVATQRIGEHVCVLDRIIREIESRRLLPQRERKSLYNKMRDLKDLRVLADYKNEEIRYDKAETALNFSKDIRDLLSKII